MVLLAATILITLTSCTVEPIRIDVRGQGRSQPSESQSAQPTNAQNQPEAVWVRQTTASLNQANPPSQTPEPASQIVVSTDRLPETDGNTELEPNDNHPVDMIMENPNTNPADTPIDPGGNTDPNQMMMMDPDENMEQDPNQMMMMDPDENMEQDPNDIRILVFSKTAGYRHGSIGPGKTAIQQLAAEHNNQGQFQIAVDMSEDSGQFTAANLSRYAAVIFLSTTGNLFNDTQKRAFETYIRAGGGFVGIHSATDTEYNWAWYGRLVGAYFNGHPNIQRATLAVEGPTVPATAPYSATFTRTDEWYNFRPNPRQNGVRVLLTLDESTYSGGRMGDDHPIAWCQVYEGGRSFYTGGGHTNSSFSEPEFRRHLFAGILFAAVGSSNLDCIGE